MAQGGVERAIELASRAFDGRTDRQGDPYIGHAIRVMRDVEGDDAQMVALLHDVFEWGTVSLRDFVKQKFPKRVVDAVDALTKREGESLAEHIDRVHASELASVVKIADLRDNACSWRLDRIDDAALRDELLAMYRETAELMGTTIEEICGDRLER